MLKSLKKSLIYNSLLKYGHSNFSLAILEICNTSSYTSKRSSLNRESFYISWALKIYGEKVLNILNIAGSSLGDTHLSDSKLKMSVSKKGNRNIMFNKKHLEERRKSISLKMKGRLGHLHTDITRTKISESLRGKNTSKEARDNISAACKGSIHTEETKAKLRIAMMNKNLV